MFLFYQIGEKKHCAEYQVWICLCSGLLHAGDRIVEVNGFPVDGMEPEQVIQVVVNIT